MDPIQQAPQAPVPMPDPALMQPRMDMPSFSPGGHKSHKKMFAIIGALVVLVGGGLYLGSSKLFKGSVQYNPEQLEDDINALEAKVTAFEPLVVAVENAKQAAITAAEAKGVAHLNPQTAAQAAANIAEIDGAINAIANASSPAAVTAEGEIPVLRDAINEVVINLPADDSYKVQFTRIDGDFTAKKNRLAAANVSWNTKYTEIVAALRAFQPPPPPPALNARLAEVISAIDALTLAKQPLLDKLVDLVPFKLSSISAELNAEDRLVKARENKTALTNMYLPNADPANFKTVSDAWDTASSRVTTALTMANGEAEGALHNANTPQNEKDALLAAVAGVGARVAGVLYPNGGTETKRYNDLKNPTIVARRNWETTLQNTITALDTFIGQQSGTFTTLCTNLGGTVNAENLCEIGDDISLNVVQLNGYNDSFVTQCKAEQPGPDEENEGLVANANGRSGCTVEGLGTFMTPGELSAVTSEPRDCARHNGVWNAAATPKCTIMPLPPPPGAADAPSPEAAALEAARTAYDAIEPARLAAVTAIDALKARAQLLIAELPSLSNPTTQEEATRFLVLIQGQPPITQEAPGGYKLELNTLARTAMGAIEDTRNKIQDAIDAADVLTEAQETDTNLGRDARAKFGLINARECAITDDFCLIPRILAAATPLENALPPVIAKLEAFDGPTAAAAAAAAAAQGNDAARVAAEQQARDLSIRNGQLQDEIARLNRQTQNGSAGNSADIQRLAAAIDELAQRTALPATATGATASAISTSAPVETIPVTPPPVKVDPKKITTIKKKPAPARLGISVIPDESTEAARAGTAATATTSTTSAGTTRTGTQSIAANTGPIRTGATSGVAASSQASASVLHGAAIKGKTGPELLLYPLGILLANGLYAFHRRRRSKVK